MCVLCTHRTLILHIKHSYPTYFLCFQREYQKRVEMEMEMERRRRVGFIQQGSRERNDVEISLKKVQVVYYLSRNGQLEHPHFMELYHHPRHHLKLKDVIDKLTVLRGRGMPSLFSWSCKRSYKNGYVWNDLSENDIIHPADGSEYILKGSELFHGSSSSAPKLFNNPKPMQTPNHHVEITEEEEHEKRPGNHTPGEQNSKQQTELQLGDDSSPPSSSSSDPAAESAPSLNSVLRQLIVCGAGASGRKSGALRIRAVSRLASTSVNHGEEEEDEIRCMSENPRFGNSQGEEKEYFSGSIVEAMAMSERSAGTEPTLKKSSSCNEERSSKVGIGKERQEREERGGGGGGGDVLLIKGNKCIPGRKKSMIIYK